MHMFGSYNIPDLVIAQNITFALKIQAVLSCTCNFLIESYYDNT